MTPPQIGILTLANDFHALVIKKALEDAQGVSCRIVETDRLCGHGDLTWSNGNSYRPRLATAAGDRIDVGELDPIWWRRGNVSQDVPRHVIDPARVDLISNDCHFALLGLLLDKFHGAWVSDPQATREAQNKLLQIVRGTAKEDALTTMVNPQMLGAESCLRLCPAIYQELIPGDQYLRICCFGDAVHAGIGRIGGRGLESESQRPGKTVRFARRPRFAVASSAAGAGAQDGNLRPEAERARRSRLARSEPSGPVPLSRGPVRASIDVCLCRVLEPGGEGRLVSRSDGQRALNGSAARRHRPRGRRSMLAGWLGDWLTGQWSATASRERRRHRV